MTARRVCSAALVGFALLAGRASAYPVCGGPPRPVQAVPRYSAPLSIEVRFIDPPATNETGFEVWRSTNGGAFARVQTLPPAQNSSWRDTAVDAASSYVYRVEECAGAACASLGTFATSLRVVWPIAGGREVLHGFNEVLAWAGVRGGDGVTAAYHDGVDLNRTSFGATPGDDLLAPRGGVISNAIKDPAADDDFIGIQVQVGVDAFGQPVVEFDSFNHVANDAANQFLVCVGDVVAPGQKIGVVGSRGFGLPTGDFHDHVHSMVTKGSAIASSDRNFLDIFTAAGDRDPNGTPPSFVDENGDGKSLLFRDPAEADREKYLDYDKDTKPLRGNIDILAEVLDAQGSSPAVAPLSIGYWIEGPLPPPGAGAPAFADFDDVKASATPYALFDRSTVYFGAAPITDCSLISHLGKETNSGCEDVAGCTSPSNGAACNSVLKQGTLEFQWPVLHHFIVTHAKGETGTRGDIDASQHWNTNAKEDGGGASPAYANYAGKPDTTKATEARFPDGDYTVHIIASDYAHANVDLTVPDIRLENFAPFIRRLDVYQDVDGNPATQLSPDLPGCEVALYAYQHKGNPNPYPGTNHLAVSQKGVFARANRKICVHIVFSEGVDRAQTSVAIDPQGSAGAPAVALAGSFVRTWSRDDSWRGSWIPSSDATGSSDSSLLLPNADAVVRVVSRDKVDRLGNQRGLDEDGDGAPEADRADESHRFKLDLSSPSTTIQSRKTP